MILRHYIACATCNKTYRLRVQVGLRKKQKHIFHCVTCSESIGITLDNETGISLDENCVDIDADDDALPYYLSPDFVAGPEEIHDPMAFPALDFMKGMMQQIGNLKELEDVSSIEEASKNPRWHLDTIWPIIQKAWRLADSGNYLISNSIVLEFCKKNGIEENLSSAKYFLLDAISPLSYDVVDEIRSIVKSNEPEFKKFIHYYSVNLKQKHNKDYYSLLTDFFKAFADFTQVLLYRKDGQTMPTDAQATSVNFDSVKNFYAKAYEFYAGAISIFTCINNIKAGRPFDRLSKISLDKYLTTDKAERRNSFAQNEIFFTATSEFDSQIRNASYHNWFYLADSKQVIEYRSGGTGALRQVSYANYLRQCVDLLRQICELFILELIFDEYARSYALVKQAPRKQLFRLAARVAKNLLNKRKLVGLP